MTRWATLLLVFTASPLAAAEPKEEFSAKDLPKFWFTDLWQDEMSERRDYKATPYITAAIKLQSLGEEKAKAILREVAGNRDHNAIILCRMLFTEKQKGEFRRPRLGEPSCLANTKPEDWPLEPIEIVDGVPFFVVTGYTLGGEAETPGRYLDYCVKNCDWKQEKYQSKTPKEQQKAMEKLITSPKLKGKERRAELALSMQIERADILIADFEGETYGEGWKTTGTAFGTGPARGTLPNQMPVSGYQGKGLVNSFSGGDASTGTLTSPEFKIERKHLNFLVGGGKHPKTCINLLVGGKVARTATGPNDKPGGSERLDWHSWDVAEYQGKAAVIQIVDEEKGGWGHINVDHITQSDAKRQDEAVSQAFDIQLPYFYFPVKNGAPKRRVKVSADGKILREFDIELGTDDKPDFWAPLDVAALGCEGSFKVETTLPAGVNLMKLVRGADSFADAKALYKEKHRPLFHFTSRIGWLNDPNGLVHHNGEWHIFYQHNPYGREWGNMHWGHAVSKDLFRWKEEGIALYPKKYGDWAFSGSAVVDSGNTSGWGTKEKPPLVLAYTSTGRGECIAFSGDNGRAWKEYDGNPVVKHAGRDPKLAWYEKGKHWVMAVYDEFEKKQWIAFYTSPDLKKWTFASHIEGFYECPDLFELPLPNLQLKGGPPDTKWVLYAADGKYLIGDFDGKNFKPDFKEKKQLWYGNFYAAQTFDNAPKWDVQNSIGPPPPSHPRRVQIGWARGVTFPGTPFNQQMTVPVELRLQAEWNPPAPKPPQLVATPVPEILSLREGKGALTPQTIKETVILAEKLDAFDADLSLELPDATKGFTLDLRGTKLVYDAAKRTLTCKNVVAPLHPGGGRIHLRALVDRGSVEVFGNGGAVAMSVAAIPDEKKQTLELTPTDGALIVRGGVWRMKSAWEK